MNSQPSPETPAPERPELTDRDRAMLDFEGQWFHHAGSKEQAVRSSFDLSATRYYQLLNALVDRPEALVYAPMTVKRLRRLREDRRRRRAVRIR